MTLRQGSSGCLNLCSPVTWEPLKKIPIAEIQALLVLGRAWALNLVLSSQVILLYSQSPVAKPVGVAKDKEDPWGGEGSLGQPFS